ncbi:glycosyltransferase family 2 protein [Sesbania bispinosa]|nr:glycosyltransferase family 2 protein [Sesbania bispinosa]
MAGGSGQNDSGNVNTTIMSDDVPNVYSEFVTENVEVTHDMDDEYVSDDLESLSTIKRQRKSANPRQLIPKSLQNERLQKKCLKKGPAAVPQSQDEIQDRLLATLSTKLSTSITDLTRVTHSPPANYIKSAKDMNKIMGLARQVLSGNQPDWNVVTKDIAISPELLHTYNTVQELADLAKTMTTAEGGNSSEGGGTKPAQPFMPSQNDGPNTDGIIPTQTSGTDGTDT